MARLRVFLSEAAVSDLEGLYYFLIESGASGETALNYVLDIESRCQDLGSTPLIGRLRTDIRDGLRIFPVKRRSVIAYVIKDDVVLITNIFHAGQDFEALLPK